MDYLNDRYKYVNVKVIQRDVPKNKQLPIEVINPYHRLYRTYRTQQTLPRPPQALTR